MPRIARRGAIARKARSSNQAARDARPERSRVRTVWIVFLCSRRVIRNTRQVPGWFRTPEAAEQRARVALAKQRGDFYAHISCIEHHPADRRIRVPAERFENYTRSFAVDRTSVWK